MWPKPNLCAKCKCRYTLTAVCALCAERDLWRGAGQDARREALYLSACALLLLAPALGLLAARLVRF